MLGPFVSWVGIALAGAVYLQAARVQSPSPAPPPASQYRAVLNRYCTTILENRRSVRRISCAAKTARLRSRLGRAVFLLAPGF